MGELARITAAEVIAAGDAVVRYRALAENCRKAAEQARSDIDKKAWIQLANDWTKLADGIERRVENSD